MKLSPIEKVTFSAIVQGRTPFKSSDSGWKWVQLANNIHYRVVSQRTLNSLIRKRLILKNGSNSFFLTRFAQQFIVPVEYKVNWEKLEKAVTE